MRIAVEHHHQHHYVLLPDDAHVEVPKRTQAEQRQRKRQADGSGKLSSDQMALVPLLKSHS